VTGSDDARYSTCFVCNESLGYWKLRPAIAWADDRTASGEIILWAVFAHPECVRRVAHPDFDLEANASTGLDPEK
jgi:hypothetical protein